MFTFENINNKVDIRTTLQGPEASTVLTVSFNTSIKGVKTHCGVIGEDSV